MAGPSIGLGLVPGSRKTSAVIWGGGRAETKESSGMLVQGLGILTMDLDPCLSDLNQARVPPAFFKRHQQHLKRQE